MSEMSIFLLEKICWGFFPKLPGEETAVHSSTGWGAGQFAHHWQLVGLAGHQARRLPAAGVHRESDRVDTFPLPSWCLGNKARSSEEKVPCWKRLVCRNTSPVLSCGLTRCYCLVARSQNKARALATRTQKVNKQNNCVSAE